MHPDPRQHKIHAITILRVPRRYSLSMRRLALALMLMLLPACQSSTQQSDAAAADPAASSKAAQPSESAVTRQQLREIQQQRQRAY
jgi:hypothetical protein